MDAIVKTRVIILFWLLAIIAVVCLGVWWLTPQAPKAFLVVPGSKPSVVLTPAPPIVGTAFITYTKNTVIGNIKGVPHSDKVKSGILVDMDTGHVIWAKSPRTVLPIASVTKVITTLVALEEMRKNPEIRLTDRIAMTPTSAKITVGGLRVSVGTEFTREELFKAMLIGSKNDAANLTAESLGEGSESEFVHKMNEYAKQRGLKQTIFYNSHGLPSAAGDNCSTAEEVLVFSREALTPQILQWSAQPLAVIGDSKITVATTNHLIGRRRVLGVDGLKTGYTKKAKSCLVFSCQRNGKRLVGVLLGVDGSNNRDDFCAALLDWAYKRLAKTK